MPRLVLDGRELRLSFCTNVLPGTDAPKVLSNLDAILPGVRQRALGNEDPFGLGLWLPAPAALSLDAEPAAAQAFGEALHERGLECFTLNGFPYGDFHLDRVKDGVFRPTWAQPQRLEYTLALGRLLAGWMAEGESGSISTLTGGFKAWGEDSGFRARIADSLVQLAVAWRDLAQRSGREIVLGLEPEPRSTLETTDEVVRFFEDELLSARALEPLIGAGESRDGAEAIVRRHIGLCYDACHQAVEFESMEDSLDRLRAAGVRIAKLQITSALRVREPGRDAQRLQRLARFAEPRYLHQVARRDAQGVHLADDLEDLLPDPPPAWRDADEWRIHFHVPVHREQISGFETTRDELLRCLRWVLRHDLTRHLEVETYTWGVLPGESPQGDELAAALGEELRWTLDVIDAESSPSASGV